jgi:hypothetical protein
MRRGNVLKPFEGSARQFAREYKSQAEGMAEAGGLQEGQGGGQILRVPKSVPPRKILEETRQERTQ